MDFTGGNESKTNLEMLSQTQAMVMDGIIQPGFACHVQAAELLLHALGLALLHQLKHSFMTSKTVDSAFLEIDRSRQSFEGHLRHIHVPFLPTLSNMWNWIVLSYLFCGYANATEPV